MSNRSKCQGQAPRRQGSTSRFLRGFTLVELMVALTGGLAFTIFVFMLTRDVSRFFQQQTRLADATVGVLSGYQRLRADVARAGFLASPNLAKDPERCPPGIVGNVLSGINNAQWAARPEMQNLALARLVVGGSLADNAANTVLTNNGLTPDQLILAGNYASAEQFAVQSIVAGVIELDATSDTLIRARYDAGAALADRDAVLAQLFPVGRILRIHDPKTNKDQYTLITGSSSVTGTDPIVNYHTINDFRTAHIRYCHL